VFGWTLESSRSRLKNVRFRDGLLRAIPLFPPGVSRARGRRSIQPAGERANPKKEAPRMQPPQRPDYGSPGKASVTVFICADHRRPGQRNELTSSLARYE
jgi:hypothetical protein